jgi:hypothetical protein
MPLRMLPVDHQWEYVLLEDRDSAQPTVFTLRRLTWAQLQQVEERNPLGFMERAAVERARAAAQAEGREASTEEIGQLIAEFADPDEVLRGYTRMHARAVELGLVSVRGVLDVNGAPLDPIAGEQFLPAAPEDVLRELGEEILRGSRLTEPFRKN